MSQSIEESIILPQDPDTVWQVVGDVANLGAWLPGVESSRLEGAVRHVVLARGGPPARERIIRVDDAARTYSYEYLDGSLPVDRYTAEIAVGQVDEGTEVRWTGQLSAATEEAEKELATLIAGMYAAALAALAKHL